MKKILFLLLFPILCHAQINQTGRAGLEVITKLFGSPYFLAKQLGKIGAKKRYKKLFTDIKQEDNLWKKGQYKCSEACPKDYRILKYNALREATTEVEYYDEEADEIKTEYRSTNNITQADRLAFLNEDEDFKSIAPRTFGYCWGHASLNRRLQYLAIFTNNFSEDQSRELKKKGKKRFYKKRIRKILRGKLQVIPGYNSIYDFSNDPEIMAILKKMTVNEWKKKAVTTGGLSMYIKPKNMKQSKLDTFIKEIEAKLKTYQTPLIYFNHDELNKYIHVAPVYKIVKEETRTLICFMDNHDEIADHLDCGKRVEITNKGNIYYNGWDDYDFNETGVNNNIKYIGFPPEERIENIQFVKQLKRYCEKVTECTRD